MELAILCNCEIGLILFDGNNRLYEFKTDDMRRVIRKYSDSKPQESFGKEDVTFIPHYKPYINHFFWFQLFRRYFMKDNSNAMKGAFARKVCFIGSLWMMIFCLCSLKMRETFNLTQKMKRVIVMTTCACPRSLQQDSVKPAIVLMKAKRVRIRIQETIEKNEVQPSFLFTFHLPLFSCNSI